MLCLSLFVKALFVIVCLCLVCHCWVHFWHFDWPSFLAFITVSGQQCNTGPQPEKIAGNFATLRNRATVSICKEGVSLEPFWAKAAKLDFASWCLFLRQAGRISEAKNLSLTCRFKLGQEALLESLQGSSFSPSSSLFSSSWWWWWWWSLNRAAGEILSDQFIWTKSHLLTPRRHISPPSSS